MSVYTSPNSDEQFNALGAPWSVAFDDFKKVYPLTSALPVSASSPYIGTALAAGTTSQATNDSHGVMVFSGAATTDNSGAQIQDDVGSFTFLPGQRLEAVARVKLSDATQTECFAGFAIVSTTLLNGTGTLAGGFGAAGMIGFYKPDDEANWYGIVRVGSVNLVVIGPIAQPITNTYDVLKVTVDMDPTVAQLGTVSFQINGKTAGPNPSASFPLSTALYTRSFSFNSGDAAVTRTCSLDYLGGRQQRVNT